MFSCAALFPFVPDFFHYEDPLLILIYILSRLPEPERPFEPAFSYQPHKLTTNKAGTFPPHCLLGSGWRILPPQGLAARNAHRHPTQNPHPAPPPPSSPLSSFSPNDPPPSFFQNFRHGGCSFFLVCDALAFAVGLACVKRFFRCIVPLEV